MRIVRYLHRVAPALIAAAAAPWSAAAAQSHAAVRITVVDAAGIPVAGADVALLRGLREIVSAQQTDARGQRVLDGPAEDGDYEVVVRRIGFRRADLFFTRAGRDTIALRVSLERAVQSLAPVKITATEDATTKSYFIDADQIAASDRTLIDATDIVTKLRPDMIYGRGGPREHCAPLSRVWVNGTLVRLPPLDQTLVAEKRMAMRAARSSPHLAPQGRAAIPLSVLSILTSIKPEHIAEMRSHDCGDFSIEENQSTSAIFIVLKPGVRYLPGVGSFVDAEAARRLEQRGAGSQVNPIPVLSSDSLPAYRFRLIGVYDAITGDPIAGVDIVDAATGAKATTSTTGTATLVFLPEGSGTVRLERIGYRTTSVALSISPADTLPITTVLERKP